MAIGRQTLNLAAAVLCGVGSFASLIAALLSDGPKGANSRAAVLSGLLGTVGSVAWATAAYQDLAEEREAQLDIASG